MNPDYVGVVWQLGQQRHLVYYTLLLLIVRKMGHFDSQPFLTTPLPQYTPIHVPEPAFPQLLVHENIDRETLAFQPNNIRLHL
jgi:hypothetical protein